MDGSHVRVVCSGCLAFRLARSPRISPLPFLRLPFNPFPFFHSLPTPRCPPIRSSHPLPPRETPRRSVASLLSDSFAPRVWRVVSSASRFFTYRFRLQLRRKSRNPPTTNALPATTLIFPRHSPATRNHGNPDIPPPLPAGRRPNPFHGVAPDPAPPSRAQFANAPGPSPQSAPPLLLRTRPLHLADLARTELGAAAAAQQP
jgi:hypothetical protein